MQEHWNARHDVDSMHVSEQRIQGKKQRRRRHASIQFDARLLDRMHNPFRPWPVVNEGPVLLILQSRGNKTLQSRGNNAKASVHASLSPLAQMYSYVHVRIRVCTLVRTNAPIYSGQRLPNRSISR